MIKSKGLVDIEFSQGTNVFGYLVTILIAEIVCNGNGLVFSNYLVLVCSASETTKTKHKLHHANKQKAMNNHS